MIMLILFYLSGQAQVVSVPVSSASACQTAARAVLSRGEYNAQVFCINQTTGAITQQ